MNAKRLIIVFVLGLLPFIASAQRTAYDELFITATPVWPFSASAGFRADLGIYKSINYWKAHVSFIDRAKKDMSTGETVHVTRAMGGGEGMWRLLKTYDRSVNLYAGGGMMLGCEFMDLFETLSKPTHRAMNNAGYKDVRFVFGFSLTVEGEFFISRYFALVPYVRGEVLILTPYLPLDGDMGLGLRFNF